MEKEEAMGCGRSSCNRKRPEKQAGRRRSGLAAAKFGGLESKWGLQGATHRTEATERLGDDMIIIDILETPAFHK